MIFISGRLPRVACPICGTKLDAATGIEGTMPKVGDFSVCIWCSTVLRFGPSLRLVLPMAGEVEACTRLDPTLRRNLDAFRMAAARATYDHLREKGGKPS